MIPAGRTEHGQRARAAALRGRALRAAMLGALLSGSAVFGGCGSGAAIRQVTYPPSFQYLEQREVHTAMGRLARDINRLERLLTSDGAVNAQQRDQVVGVLRDMETAAAELAPQGRRTNHPRIDRNIEAFRHELQLARLAAEQEPPNYFPAGSIAGACQACHLDENTR